MVRILRAAWTSATSRSTVRSAPASPRSPSGSRRGSTPRSCAKITENPFLADFYADRPGAALQAQLFYLLNRHRQLSIAGRPICFRRSTICDYLFDKDRIFAYLNLDDNELFIYQRLFDLLAQDVPTPDLVIYLQAPTDVLLKRLQARERDPERPLLLPDEDYLRELNEAYHHFFFHYTATSLLVVEGSQFRPQDDDEALDDLVKQIKTMGRGTRYYVPRTDD